MTMKKLPRQSARLGSLSLFAAVDAPQPGAGGIADPRRVQAALDTVRVGLEEALATESTLHGWRTQNLFAAVVVALDGCELLKEEDEGVAFYDGEKIKFAGLASDASRCPAGARGGQRDAAIGGRQRLPDERGPR